MALACPLPEFLCVSGKWHALENAVHIEITIHCRRRYLNRLNTKCQTQQKTKKNMQFRKWLASQNPIDELVKGDLGTVIKQRLEPQQCVPKWCVLQTIPFTVPTLRRTQFKKNTQWQQNIASSQRQNCSRKTAPSPLSRMWNSAVPSCTSTLRWTGVNILGVLRPPTKIKTQLIWKQPQLRTSVHQILWRSPSCIQSLEICLDFWI